MKLDFFNDGHLSNEKDTKFFLFFLFFILIILILPSLLRFAKNDQFILFSSDSYYHLRIGEYIIQKGVLPEFDWLSFGGSVLESNSVFEFVLASFSSIFNIPLLYVVIYLPVFFGLISFVLLYFLFLRFDIEKNFRRIFLILLATSPVFLYLFCVSNYCYIPIFLVLASLNLYFSKRRFFRVFAFLLLLIIPFFGYLFVIFGLLLFLLIYLKTSKRDALFFSIFLGVILIFFIKEILFSFSFKNHFDFMSYDFFLADLGYLSGFSLFSLVLFVIGIIVVFNNNSISSKKAFDFFLIFIFLVLTLIFVFLNENAIFFLNFIVIYYGTYGFLYVLKFDYGVFFFRHITIFLILSCVIFMPIFYINSMTSFYPTKEAISALSFLHQTENNDFAVFSVQKHGILINYFSNHPNVIDDFSYYLDDYLQRKQEIDTMYYTRNITFVDAFFKKYNVKYVFLDQESIKEMWLHDNQGFLFLLKDNTYFEKIYDSENVLIYKYIHESGK